MSQYPPGPPANYPPGGQPGGPPPAQPGWGQQPPPTQQQPGWGQQPPPQQQPGWGQPGQPGPPGYPAGGQPGGGGGGGSAKILIGVAVVAVLAVGAFFLLSGDDSASASSPTDAVEGFFNAARDGDCSRAIGFITEASWSEGGTMSREEALADCESELGEGSGFDSLGAEIENVELVSEDGDNATVAVTISGTPGPVNVGVVKEDGSWKVDLNDLGSSPPPDGDAGDTGDLPTDGEIPDVSIPEDLDIPDISLPDDIENMDPAEICETLEDPELIEQCIEAAEQSGLG